MNIHEYQAKELLRKFGVAVPNGKVAYTVDEAVQAANDLGGPIWVVKSQIHAGGRGAGRFKNGDPDKGGVRVTKTVDDVRENAKAMLGATLVTKQTGPDGKEVKRLYIEEGCDIARELYLSMLVDRGTSRVVVMASTEGGMDIEEVAEKTPEKIVKVFIDPITGMMPYHARQIAFGLKLEGSQVRSATKFLLSMYKAFSELDASLLLLAELGFLKADDPRFASTVDAIGAQLRRGHYLFRYRAADDFGEPENAFNLCTFWYIDALASLGRRDEARAMFENMLAKRNHLGLLSEHLDTETGEQWGNFPQTFSMVGLISSAMKLSKSWEAAF